MNVIKFISVILILGVSAGLVFFGLQKMGSLVQQKLELSYLDQHVLYSLNAQEYLFEFVSAAGGVRSIYLTDTQGNTARIAMERVAKENVDLFLSTYWRQLGEGRNGGKLYSPGPNCLIVQVAFPLYSLINPASAGSNPLQADRIGCAVDLTSNQLLDLN